MNCDEFDKRIHDLLDRRSSIRSDKILRAHAQHCEPCASILEAYQKLWEGLDAFDPPELGTDFSHRVVQRAMGHQVAQRPHFAHARWIALAVAISLLIAAGLAFLWRQPGPHSPAPPPIAVDPPPREASEAPGPPFEDQLQPWPESGPLASIAAGELPLKWDSLLSEERLATVTELAGRIEPITANLSAALDAIRSTIPIGRSVNGSTPARDSVRSGLDFGQSLTT